MNASIQLLCIEDIKKSIAELWKVHAVHRHRQWLSKGVDAKGFSAFRSSQSRAVHPTVLVVIRKDPHDVLVQVQILDDAPPALVGVQTGVHGDYHVGRARSAVKVRIQTGSTRSGCSYPRAIVDVYVYNMTVCSTDDSHREVGRHWNL